jgi:NADPH-dependent glutamate synthase beta subunit-like oxidoreductase/Pyruvate/2-oxoacid:ferredoxin oxidoreductase delta subunit
MKHDLTRPPDLLHETHIGPTRVQRPDYVSLLPPCNAACPAGENIQAWLALAIEKRYKAAWQALIEENPLPAVHGRVCYHPCESSCNRAQLDSPVSIHAVERFLGDRAIRKGWQVEWDTPASGKRVLIVGAGPSGLSAAYHLTRLGHSVEIHEAGPMAGGMMHFGIPAYRMPRDILDAEIRRIEDMGVKIVLNHKVEDLIAERDAGNFDAVFVAIGAHISKHIDIPARDAGKMLDAVSFLASVEAGEAPQLGRRVAVYGGGNTAMDAARVAKRLGADEALIIYRRDREHMPAHPFEADEAIEEGVKINWLRTIKEIDATTFTVEVMEVGEDGRPHSTGKLETLEADSLILALGQNSDASLLQDIRGIKFEWDTVIVNEHMMTGHPGIFAGGDMVPSERTVTVAVGHGKKAARNIDAWLRGEVYTAPPKHPLASFDKLHVWYFTDAAQRSQESIDLQLRQSGFEEVVHGLNKTDAVFEALRCLSCGNCFECDGCFGACPERAISKLGKHKGYAVNLDKCTGCGVCFQQCPCHAIDMVAESA